MSEAVIKNRAFTLPEIMLVVIMLGILAALVAPTISDAQTDANTARAQSDINILNRQLAIYNASGGNFPLASITYGRAALILMNAGYIKRIMPPPDGFQYMYDGNLGRFTYINN